MASRDSILTREYIARERLNKVLAGFKEIGGVEFGEKEYSNLQVEYNQMAELEYLADCFEKVYEQMMTSKSLLKEEDEQVEMVDEIQPGVTAEEDETEAVAEKEIVWAPSKRNRRR